MDAGRVAKEYSRVRILNKNYLFIKKNPNLVSFPSHRVFLCTNHASFLTSQLPLHTTIITLPHM